MKSNLEAIEENGQIVGYLFDCPGCGLAHAPYVRPHKNSVGASWEFNGNIEKPTFRPSILTKVTRSDGVVSLCHLFITEGKIDFLADCTHPLAGKSVDL